MDDKHVGSDFDEFLREEGLLDDAEALAAKRVLAYQIARAMERRSARASVAGCAPRPDREPTRGMSR